MDLNKMTAINLNIKCTNGSKHTVEVDDSKIVTDLKELLVEKTSVPADQQRLIYKGHVLKDERTLESYCTLLAMGGCN